MSKIDIHNYEAYLLDLAEGNLSGEMQVELELFLIQHPELNMDLTDLALFTIDTEKITFSEKQHLKKTEQELVSEEQFIAYIEDQLPLKERMELETSCASNPFLSKELALFTKTIATPDSLIVFENKESLKRKPKVIWFNFSATQFAAAASVLFLIGLFVLWPKSDEHTLQNTSLAENPSDQKVNSSIINNDQESVKIASSQSTTILKKETPTNNSPSSKLPVISGTNTSNAAVETPVNNELPSANSINEKNNVAISPTVIETIKEEKNQTLLAAVTKTKVDVITESDDEDVPAETSKKKGIWGLAKRTLKNLNNAGVKSVNGAEEENKDNTTYALTLGKIQITHKAN